MSSRLLDDASRSSSLAAADEESGSSRARWSGDESLNAAAGALRKSHSAALHHRCSPKADDNNEADAASESRRPNTVATSSPTKFRAAASAKKKTKKASAKRTATAGDQRPRSAGLNGWGDFDADRLLLQDDDFFAAEALLDEADDVSSVADKSPPPAADPKPERARSRRVRHSAPATTVHNDPVEDFASAAPPATFDSARVKASREQPRPATHVLRQRPLAVVDFGSAQPLKSKTLPSRASALRGRIHPPTGGGPPPPTPPSLLPSRLPRLAHTPVSSTESLALPPLFGAAIPDSHETRALVFERFRGVWDLMSSRPSSADATPDSPPRDAGAAPPKSPFECSLTLMKICKVVGVSLGSAAAPPTLTLWSSSDRDVDFQSFCAYALRSAIQPALHHFKADASVDEFVASVDRVLVSLVTSAAAAGSSLPPEASEPRTGGADELRLKELAEIHSLFPRWKAGPPALGKLKAGARSSHPEPPADAQQEDPRARVTAPLFPNRRELTLQLPTHEAKAAHAESIRCKVQLHKSWQTRPVVLTATASSVALQAVRDSSAAAAAAAAGAPPALSHTPLRTNADPRGVLHHLAAAALGRLEPETRADVQGSAAARAAEHEGVQETAGDAPPPAATRGPAFKDVLVCGACAAADAALWCASCFIVFCVACWQRRHLLRVDTCCAPLAPPTKALKPDDAGGGNAGPPFAMIYLPTKPLAVGKLARGGASRRERDATQVVAPAVLPAVTSHALLPSLLPPPKGEKSTSAAADAFASTSNQAAPSSHSTSPAAASAATATRTHADPRRRARLRPSPVLLDAAQLLQS